MTQLASATSLFFKLDNSGARVPGVSGVYGISQDGIYEIQHGTECKVCEANAVIVLSSNVIATGEITVAMVSGGTTHWVKNTFATYATPQQINEFDSTLFFTLWEDKSVDASTLEQPWPHLDNSQTYQKTATLTSSMGNQSYVSTTAATGVFICHAAESAQACGALGHFGSVYQLVMFATQGFYANPDYKDANPWRAPERFTVEVKTTPNPAFPVLGTQQVGATCSSVRIGRLDRYASDGTEQRDGPPCDYNAMTLKQYQAISFIPATSPVFKYDNKLRLSFAGNPAYTLPQSGIQIPLSILFPGSFIQGVQNGNGLRASLIGNLDPLRWALGNNTFELSNQLPDGRKTYPHEWHFFGNVPSQSLQSELPPPPSQTYSNGAPGRAEIENRQFFGVDRHSQAEAFIAQRQAAISDGFYQVASQRFIEPKKLQIKIHAAGNNSLWGMRARVTFLCRNKVYRAPISIFSVTQTDSPEKDPSGNPFGEANRQLVVTIVYGFTGDWQLACERQYLGETFYNGTIAPTGSNFQSAVAAFWNGQQTPFSTQAPLGLIGNWQLT